MIVYDENHNIDTKNLTIADLIKLGQASEVTYTHGGYMMKVVYEGEGAATVSVYDLGALRFPLMWCRMMSPTAARGAVQLFNSVGYFDMPHGV